jgi:hypothetical protein
MTASRKAPLVDEAHHCAEAFSPITGRCFQVVSRQDGQAGRAYDTGRLPGPRGTGAGLALAAVGFALAALLTGPAALALAAVAIGTGTGIVTPSGSPPWLGPPRLAGWVRPWAPPRSAGNSATPAAPCWSASSPPPASA